jgi:hypothetical protein
MVPEVIPNHFLLVLMGEHHPLFCLQAVNVIFSPTGVRMNVEEFCVGVAASDVGKP